MCYFISSSGGAAYIYIRELKAHIIEVQDNIEVLKKAIEEESEEESEKELGIN